MKKFAAFGLVISFLIFFPILAQEKVEDIVKAAPSRAKYPDSSAVVIRSVQTYMLDETGKKTEDYFRALEVFNLTGREKFSDFRIPFDKNEERINVLLAKTFKPDASFVEVEAKAINDVTPPELADADMYANILHRVLSFPAVDPGSVLVIHYQKEKSNAGSLDGLVLFQLDEPMVRKELKIVIPQDRLLKYKIRGLTTDFKEEIAGAQKTYGLVSTDCPQIKPEEYMPSLGELSSRVVFSTFKDWKEASQAFSESFFKAVNPSAEVKKTTANLLKNASSRDEKIKKIFFFVVKEIRSIRFNFNEGGYDVHDAETVLKNRYGDWKDKSALLISMLQAAGISASPVLVNSRSISPEEDIPTLKQFDAILVAVSGAPKDGDLFLDPFADDSIFGYFLEGRESRGLKVTPQGVEFVPVRCLPEAESLLRNDVSVEIDGAGSIQGKMSSELSGLFDKRARNELKDKTGKELGVFYSESVNKICEDGKILKKQLSDPKDLSQKVKIGQEFSGTNFGIFQGNIMLLTIPQVPYSFSDLPATPSLAKRLYPFRMAGEAEVVSTMALKIPVGFKPLYFPESYSFQKDYGDFSVASAYDAGQGSVVIKKTLRFKKKEIPVGQYEEFKKIIESFGLPKNTLILLEKE
jgi:hypothetical protein